MTKHQKMIHFNLKKTYIYLCNTLKLANIAAIVLDEEIIQYLLTSVHVTIRVESVHVVGKVVLTVINK